MNEIHKTARVQVREGIYGILQASGTEHHRAFDKRRRRIDERGAEYTAEKRASGGDVVFVGREQGIRENRASARV